MKAPLMTFYEEIVDDNNGVYICRNRHMNRSCGVHLLRTINVTCMKVNVICADDDYCINIYDDESQIRSKTISTSGRPINGSKIRCRKCDGMVGQRNGNQIEFKSSKLKETFVSNWDGCVNEIFNEVD